MKEMHRAKCSGTGTKFPSSSLSITHTHTHNIFTCSPSWKFSEPHTPRNFMEDSPYRHDQSLAPFPAPLPSGEWGHGAENLQLLIKALSFWSLVPIQQTTRSPPLEQKSIVNTQETPRDLGTPCQEQESKTKYKNRRCSQFSYHSGNNKSVLETLY